MTTNEIILAVVCAVLVVFSLTVALVVPKRNPDFPGKRMGAFFAVAVVLVAGMLVAVVTIDAVAVPARMGFNPRPLSSGA